MSCNQADFSILSQTQAGTRNPGVALSSIDSPWLIVSNSPETISAVVGPITLYKATVPTGSGTKRFRLFFWHLNGSTVPVEFGLLVGAPGGTVSGMKLQDASGSASDLSIPGMCLAKAQLFGSLNDVTGSIPLLLETAVWSVVALPGQLVARLFEFDVVSTSDLTIRTVATLPGSGFGLFSDPVAADDVLGHVRGWWPRSGMRIKWDTDPSSSFECRSDLGSHHENWGICEGNGAPAPPELDTVLGFGRLTIGGPDYDTDNRGAYGVDLHYQRSLVNGGSAAGKCYVSLRSRNTGWKYWGAAHPYEPENPPGYEVPKIPTDLAKPNESNAVDLMQGDSVDHAVTLAPTNQPVLFKLHVVNGGAATLPCSVFLSAPGRLAAPAENPQ